MSGLIDEGIAGDNGSLRGRLRCALVCLVLALVAVLGLRVPAAMAATPAYQSPLTGNPFAAGDAASFSASPNTSPAPPTRYEEAVLADKPTLYLPLTETGGTTAYDHSGNGLDGTYDLGATHEGSGPLLDEPNAAVFGNGEVVSQSGDQLPSGSEPRTLELWVHNEATQAVTLARYGNIEGGHGFAVTLHYEALSVEAGGHVVSVPTVDGFGHWCCDNTGWHMVDVTYDGQMVEIYQDGQLLGGGELGKAETEGPGQGLRLDTSYTQCCGVAGPYGLGQFAVYPSALSPGQIGAHWSAGASLQEEPECAPAPSGPYPKAVLEDSPLVYYRVGETAAHPTARVAFDSSGHCDNGTFDLGTNAGVGALPGDENDAIYGSGQVVFQSGERLPAASAPRTIELWVHNDATQTITLARYGNIEGGHGFAVTLHYETLSVEASGHVVSATTLDGFGHWCCDNTGWHMVDVTYDGHTVEIYQDGQLIGSGALAEAETQVPGQGLRFDTSYTQCCGSAGPYGLDEAAVYPGALSSARIRAHWEAASQSPAGEAVLGGTVTNGGGGRVQACPTSGGACRVDPSAIESSGAFHMLVADGTYTVTIFPPAGSEHAPKTIGPLTVPPSDLAIDTGFSVPGGLPEGVSLSSPGRGKQEHDVPGLNWGEPSTVDVSGCKGGYGFVFVHGTNTSTGQRETRTYPLKETAPESGSYVGEIPPLVPIHGQAGVESSVACPGHTHLIPDGGPPSGGTSVILAGRGFTGATAVHFGSASAESFVIGADTEITAVAPPGSGSVPVTVTTASGDHVEIGTFNYFDVTSMDSAGGPAPGGNLVTIHGHGFTNARGVLFGTMLATAFTVVNDGEIQATAPVGFGTVDVQVLNGFALTRPTAQSVYAYQGGPPGSAAVTEPVSDTASYALASQDAGICSNIPDPSDSGGIDFGPLCQTIPDEINSVHFFGDSMAALGIAALPLLCIASGPGCAVVAAAEVIYWAWRLDVHACLLNCPNGEWFNLWIDPSGTVVDTNGNPVKEASATLLGQTVSEGPFEKLGAASGVIEPAENPENTGASGQFDWNALAGSYEVEASAPGCHAPGNAGEPNVFTTPFTLPPPAVGLLLTLECANAAPPTPTVTGLSQTAGATAGGNVVDILGQGLAEVTTVHFGPNAAVHVQPLSPYAIAAVAPAGTGTVDVTVSSAGGTSASGAADHYTYTVPLLSEGGPVIESVSPSSGPLSGGTVVTIKGRHLAGALSVEFGETSSAEVTPISTTEARAVAPASAFPSRVDVSVTTATSTSTPTLADSFTYGSPPPPAATTVTLTAAPQSAKVGEQVALTAVVDPTDGAGSVAFYADESATPLANCGAQALAAAAGRYQATCSTAALSAGGHTLKALYTGDASYAGSSNSTNVSVTGLPEPTGGEPPVGGGGGGAGMGSQGSSAGTSTSGGGGVQRPATHRAAAAKCKLVHVKVKHSKKAKTKRVCAEPKRTRHPKSRTRHGR